MVILYHKMFIIKIIFILILLNTHKYTRTKGIYVKLPAQKWLVKNFPVKKLLIESFQVQKWFIKRLTCVKFLV